MALTPVSRALGSLLVHATAVSRCWPFHSRILRSTTPFPLPARGVYITQPSVSDAKRWSPCGSKNTCVARTPLGRGTDTAAKDRVRAQVGGEGNAKHAAARSTFAGVRGIGGHVYAHQRTIVAHKHNRVGPGGEVRDARVTWGPVGSNEAREETGTGSTSSTRRGLGRACAALHDKTSPQVTELLVEDGFVHGKPQRIHPSRRNLRAQRSEAGWRG